MHKHRYALLLLVSSTFSSWMLCQASAAPGTGYIVGFLSAPFIRRRTSQWRWSTLFSRAVCERQRVINAPQRSLPSVSTRFKTTPPPHAAVIHKYMAFWGLWVWDMFRSSCGSSCGLLPVSVWHSIGDLKNSLRPFWSSLLSSDSMILGLDYGIRPQISRSDPQSNTQRWYITWNIHTHTHLEKSLQSVEFLRRASPPIVLPCT